MLLVSIGYLSYFGISTNKFNSRIENKIKESYPNINVNLQDVKILLDILKLSINLETKNPIIFVGKEEIKLEEISTTYNIKSIFIKELNLLVSSPTCERIIPNDAQMTNKITNK